MVGIKQPVFGGIIFRVVSNTSVLLSLLLSKIEEMIAISMLGIPDDLIPQRVGKLDGFNIAQGLPLELVGQI